MPHWVRIGVAAPAIAAVLVASGCRSFDQNSRSPAGGAAAPATTAATGGPAPSASTGGPARVDPASPAGPEVTAQDAQAIALDSVGGGWIMKTDMDEVDDVMTVWEVTVASPDGLRRQVFVDMTNGSVLHTEVDD